MRNKILYYFLLFILLGCRTNDSEMKTISSNNIFIDEVGIYNYREYVIEIKQFKDGSLIYGIFGLYKNECLYQQNLNEVFSNYSKWTFYIDNQDKIWFYNSDRDLLSVFFKGKNNEFIFEKQKKNLPILPKELQDYINR